MNTLFVVDRVEGEVLIVINQETQESFDVPRLLAPHLAEGDVFSITKHAADHEDAKSRLDRLKKRSPQPSSGDIIDL